MTELFLTEGVITCLFNDLYFYFNKYIDPPDNNSGVKSGALSTLLQFHL